MVVTGRSAFGGIAIGRIALYKKEEVLVKRQKVDDPQKEIDRFMQAKETAKEQLAAIYEQSVLEVGKMNAMVFEAHQVMLDDQDYIESVTNIINTQSVNAEFAVATTSDNFAQMFDSMEDAYMRGRAADVRDVSNRVIEIMQGMNTNRIRGEEPVILFAEDLTPSETVQLDKSRILAFVTRKGSIHSHTAILARTMNIPAVVNVGFDEEIEDGQYGIVDGYEGKIYLNPDVELLKTYTEKKMEEIRQKELLRKLKGKKDITPDGREISLYANIGCVADVADALANDATGIGLFRSEFLYLQSEDYPSEEAQFLVYRTVAENMAGKKVIIRTLDIGADKKIGYFNLQKEENPALGYRGIRICLDRKDMFRTQLRAIYRAGYYGNISIMFPMIISVEEVRKIKELTEEVKKELSEEGISYKDCELGVMIETPAAVMISDLLAKEVDFFSIGTNDLAQYTLAIDRQNPELDSFYDPHHPAILRMIKMVVENAHKENCRVGICGELGADPELTETFLAMGVDELSVSPSMVLKVREKIREANLKTEQND